MASVARIAEVMAQTGLPRSSLYAKVKAGTFPKPIKLGTRSVGWRVDDIEGWIATRPSATGCFKTRKHELGGMHNET
jgi:prophage regulatory protein